MRAARLAAGVRATMKTVDTCAAEFEAHTPYHYSTYEDERRGGRGDRPKIIILGSGPNRIGQGVEFDYCCVQASFALHDAGFETVMINCNPETVSTDYDTSDRLYFEPVTWEDVSNVLDVESATGTVAGVIVSLGGQTPLKLAALLPPGLVLGTSPESIDLAEDRERWNALCARLEIPQPAGGTAVDFDDARAVVGPGRLPGAGPAELRARRAGPWRSSTTTTTCAGPWTAGRRSARSGGRAVCRRSGRCWWTGSSRTPSRWTSTPYATHRRGAHRRRHGARRGGRRALR